MFTFIEDSGQYELNRITVNQQTGDISVIGLENTILQITKEGIFLSTIDI